MSKPQVDSIEEELDNLSKTWLSEPTNRIDAELFGDTVFRRRDLILKDLVPFVQQAITNAVAVARKEVLEEVKAKLQQLWETDPRSKQGKKLIGSETWILGYRTGQKEIANYINYLSKKEIK